MVYAPNEIAVRTCVLLVDLDIFPSYLPVSSIYLQEYSLHALDLYLLFQFCTFVDPV